MLGSTVSANFKNLNATFGSFSATFSMTWTTTTNQDTIMFYNGEKRFMPLEAFAYLISRTGTTACTITAGNAQGASTYFTAYTFTALTAGNFGYLTPSADGTSRVALAPGGALWVRLGGSNPFSATNTVNVKFFISGYYR